jgi:hypothetical protein
LGLEVLVAAEIIATFALDLTRQNAAASAWSSSYARS